MTAAVFYILASVALLSAVMVIWSRNVVHSAIYLVLTFLCVAGVYVLLQAEFVAVVQVFVYAGGIVVLFLFVIMLVNLKDALGPRVRVHATVSAIVGAATTILLVYVAVSGGLKSSYGRGVDLSAQGGNLQQVGWALYGDYLLPFEIASILLLVAMIGAIVLARQKYRGDAVPIPPHDALVFSLLLFSVGVAGVLTRRNAIIILMSIELMMNAANINFIAFGLRLHNITGQVFSVFTIAVAAGEVAVGLAVVLALFRNRDTVYVDQVHIMKG